VLCDTASHTHGLYKTHQATSAPICLLHAHGDLAAGVLQLRLQRVRRSLAGRGRGPGRAGPARAGPVVVRRRGAHHAAGTWGIRHARAAAAPRLRARLLIFRQPALLLARWRGLVAVPVLCLDSRPLVVRQPALLVCRRGLGAAPALSAGVRPLLGRQLSLLVAGRCGFTALFARLIARAPAQSRRAARWSEERGSGGRADGGSDRSCRARSTNRRGRASWPARSA